MLKRALAERPDDRLELGTGLAALLLPADDPCRTTLALALPAAVDAPAWPLDLYRLHYGTLAAFQHQGEVWRAWNSAVRDLLVEHQRSDGCFEGSWDWQGTGFHGHDTGRLLSTVLACLALEVYYRSAAPGTAPVPPPRQPAIKAPEPPPPPPEALDLSDAATTEVSLVLVPDGLERGQGVAAYQRAWETREAPVTVALGVAAGAPESITPADFNGRVERGLAAYELAGERSTQPPILVHAFGPLPWAWTLQTLAAIQAYEAV